MKKMTIIFTTLALCATVFVLARDKAAADENPLLQKWTTPFEAPPFHLIQTQHYLPAFQQGIAEQKAEIAAIVDNPNRATFANTIEALDRSGALLNRVGNVFFNLLEAVTSDQMQKIAEAVSPLLSRHQDDILMNDRLFARIKTVTDQKSTIKLTPEQDKLLDQFHRNFIRNGAGLDESAKSSLRRINEELALLSLKFSDNMLKETNAFRLVIDQKTDLAGLPVSLIAAAADAANAVGLTGKWVFTLHAPSIFPFLQAAENRELRKQILLAYANRGNRDNEYDNKKIAARIARLRVERSNLLGYPTFADYTLTESMAKKPESVFKLLQQVWSPAMARARREVQEMEELIRKEGQDFRLEPWDWWYYSDKVKKAKYDLDDEALKPFFQLDKVREGAFQVANRLWGITFSEQKDVPVFHPEVRVFEVKEADGSHIGLLYTDYHPRQSKRGGAWMNNFRDQITIDGRRIAPIVANTGNFTRPSGEVPALLTLDEVTTLFHEFGHALHGLLSNCTYRSLSGTAVPRDFVELPSQIMENWAQHPEVIKQYARHYRTGEPIPDALLEKVRKAGQFNQGFITGEYLAASLLDMEWHTLKEPVEMDVPTFEARILEKIGLIGQIIPRYRTTYFNHIWGGGYAAGYYSYIWSEVLDADAFEAFKEKGIFDRQTASSFRTHILSKGGSEDAQTLYLRFRGRAPGVEPLLRRRGLLEEAEKQ